jgi:hypothetical protein
LQAAILEAFEQYLTHFSWKNIRAMCGNTHYYDKNFDRINVKNETVLQGSDIPQQNVTTSEDPMIKEVIFFTDMS